MADSKITALPALGSFASGDLIPMVDSPSGVPETKKATIDQVKSFIEGSVNTWTASNTFSTALSVNSSIKSTSTIFTGDATGSSGGIENLSNSSRSIGIASDSANVGTNSIITFKIDGSEKFRCTTAGNIGILTTSPTSTLTVNGSLSKTSGSFNIAHPLPSLNATHRLLHSFVEAPTADNIYRGKIKLQNGQASVNIDSSVGMTDGTFSALNGNIQVFLQNDSGWSMVRGSVDGNMLSIVSQDQQSTDIISWLVIGERQDQHMLDTTWTDEFGRPILEPLNPPEPEDMDETVDIGS